MIDEDPRRLKDLILLGTEISEVKDLDVLLERILTTAREFTGADAGSIYIREGDLLRFSYTQNDTIESRLEPGEKLIYTTFSIPIDNRSIAGYVAETGVQLNIIDAYELPDDLPYHFDKSFDKSADYSTRSILTVPLSTRNSRIIGVLQLINAHDRTGAVSSFEPELEPYVAFFAGNAAAALEQANLTRAIILRMIGMTELRDPKETGAHVNRVAGYAVELYERWARKYHVPESEFDRNRDLLRMAAMLHDVGKVAISDVILKKHGELNDEEYETMKTHTWLGARLFLYPTSPFEETARDVALSHHERFDGSGYPGRIDIATGQPLDGETEEGGKPRALCRGEIPLFGRIVAIADVYDALSSSRSYKSAWSEKDTLAEIRNNAGTHFDPELVDLFFKAFPAIRSIGARYSEQNE